jgi:hypothetical protein
MGHNDSVSLTTIACSSCSQSAQELVAHMLLWASTQQHCHNFSRKSGRVSTQTYAVLFCQLIQTGVSRVRCGPRAANEVHREIHWSLHAVSFLHCKMFWKTPDL